VLACDPVLSTRIAAFAPVSGAYYVDTLPCHPSTVSIPCAAGRNDIPVLAFHGGNDTTIDFDGGERKKECLPSIPHFIQSWAAREGLSPNNVSTPLNANTTIYSFSNASHPSLIELVFEKDIGHDWPSVIGNADNEERGHHPASFSATPMILDFFAHHSLTKSSSVFSVQ
jgi:poly(3-hydroxybutyrate) depolymerase